MRNFKKNTSPKHLGKVEQIKLQGKTYTFRSPRWVENGCYEVTRVDLLKKLNSKLVEKWEAEGSGNLRKYCNSNKVGDNSNLAYQCAKRVLAADPSDFGALSVVVAAERAVLKQNSGYAVSLLKTVQEVETRLAHAGQGANTGCAHTALAAAYLDLAELHASGPWQNPNIYQTYMKKAKLHLAKVPRGEYTQNVWARFRSLERAV